MLTDRSLAWSRVTGKVRVEVPALPSTVVALPTLATGSATTTSETPVAS